MKITGLTTRILEIDASPRYKGGIIPPDRPKQWHFPLVILDTDEGIQGYSMIYGPHGDGKALADILHDSFWPQIPGTDPSQLELVWSQLYRRQRHLYNLTDTLLGVIDVALWDIRGKSAGMPIAAMLGQYTDKMPAYQTALSENYSEEEIVEEVISVKTAGYNGYKLQLRAGPQADIPRLRAAREAVGEAFPLMQDPNSGYSLPEALTVGHELDSLVYHWYEEPLPEARLDYYQILNNNLKTPVLAGETTTFAELANFFNSGHMTMARGDVLIKGGITGLRKAMAACEMMGYNLEIHTTNTPLLDVANLHVACACLNTTMVEVHHPVFRFGLKNHPYEIGKDGNVVLPKDPGLGALLDWDWVEAATTAERTSTLS